MKTVAIIQARMGSTRLPGKVLADVAGRPVLQRVVERTRRARGLDEVVVATSVAEADGAVASACAALGVPVFRGSEDDVLSRYLGAAEAFGADVCVRITSDCPLIDPDVTAMIVSRYRGASPPADYASNKIPQSFPRGLDTEVFSRAALRRAAAGAKSAYQRTHVTPYFYENPGLFRLLSLVSDVDRQDWRWTVDTAEDLQFVRAVYERLGPGRDFTWLDVVALLEREPQLRQINAHVRQKGLQEG